MYGKLLNTPLMLTLKFKEPPNVVLGTNKPLTL